MSHDPPPPVPSIAIIIPFTEWNGLVEECVSHCLELEYPDFTLLLVPNKGARIPGPVRENPRVRIVETETHQMSVKRNRAAESFAADWYGSIDSDAYPEPDWLSAAAKVANDVPEAWILGGPNISPPATTWQNQAVVNALKSALVGASRAYMKRVGEKDRFVEDVWTCNAFIRKEVFSECGGFDAELYTAEDTELARRLVVSGKKLYYSDSIRVFHHNRPLFGPFLRQKFVMGYGALPYIKKHFGAHILFCFAPILALGFLLLGWLGVFVSGPFFLIWMMGCAFYGAAVVLEAARWSRSLTETPITALTIVLGNLTPGVGLLLALFGVKVRTHRIYTNFDEQHVSGESSPSAH